MKGSAATRAREAHVVDLRAQGLSFRQIGAQLDISDRMASRVFWRAIDRVPLESAEQMRALEHHRLDAVLAAVWPQAMAGSVRHAMVCVRVCERRARLFGLDAPARTELQVTREEHDAMDREIEELLAAYGIDSNGGPGLSSDSDP